MDSGGDGESDFGALLACGVLVLLAVGPAVRVLLAESFDFYAATFCSAICRCGVIAVDWLEKLYWRSLAHI